jgi:hypothetical protein
MLAILLLGVGLLFSTGPAGVVVAQPEPQLPYEISNQPTEGLSPGLVYLRLEDASLTRYPDRIVVDLSMDTPVPGTYVYPSTVPPERQASPEAFTLWVFIFNAPEACTRVELTEACGPDDFSEKARGGAYGVAGHVTSLDHSGGAFELDRDAGGRMTLHGEVKVGQQQRPPVAEGSTTYPLENPMGAEVHLAVAPHGQVDPATIASELYEPAGDPTCGCWWLAFFESPVKME